MDISEDDYNFDKPADDTDEAVTKNSLTKTLFQKNNSSLTSSSSSSSSDDDDGEDSDAKPKSTSTIFKLDEPMESSTEPDTATDKNEIEFVVNKNSELELLSNNDKTEEKMSTNATESLFNDADSPLSNVEWTDFSNFAGEKASSGAKVLPLSDPWETKEAAKEIVAPSSTVADSIGDNWANFD